MITERNDDQLIVYLSGDMDHCCAQKLREEIEIHLRDQSIRKLIMDFSRVSFMDSSGIGMLIGRYKTMADRGGLVFARGMQPSVKRLFRMAGLHRIIAEQEPEGGIRR
ncbi:MAG: STAS domain-containing protein [Clostridia bacterium]|nr:STAS domain-containing protein [Clostridia bacterium]